MSPPIFLILKCVFQFLIQWLELKNLSVCISQPVLTDPPPVLPLPSPSLTPLPSSSSLSPVAGFVSLHLTPVPPFSYSKYSRSPILLLKILPFPHSPTQYTPYLPFSYSIYSSSSILILNILQLKHYPTQNILVPSFSYSIYSRSSILLFNILQFKHLSYSIYSSSTILYLTYSHSPFSSIYYSSSILLLNMLQFLHSHNRWTTVPPFSY